MCGSVPCGTHQSVSIFHPAESDVCFLCLDTYSDGHSESSSWHSNAKITSVSCCWVGGYVEFYNTSSTINSSAVSFRFYGSNRLHCVVSEARSCEQRVQGCHASCSIPSLYAEFACKCNPSKHALSSDARKVIEDNEVLTWFESRWLFRTLSLNAEYMHLHYYDVVNNALFVTGIAAGRYRRLCARRPITLFVSCTALLYYTSHAACSQQRCSATTNWTWWMNEWMNRSISLFARKCRR